MSQPSASRWFTDDAVMTCRHDSRGFALVVVLWSIAVLALLGSQLTSTARVQSRIAAAARDSGAVEAAVDGGIYQAIFALCATGGIGLSGQPVVLQIGNATVEILVEDEASRVNPNVASIEMLRGLMVAAGADQGRAGLIAGEIVDWRNRSAASVFGGEKIDLYRNRGLPYRSADRPFDSVDESGLIPDMTPDLLARLRPWLSVYRNSDDTGVNVRQAAGNPGEQGLVNPNIVMRVTAAATIRGRARAVRSAVVLIHAGTEVNGKLYQVLVWE